MNTPARWAAWTRLIRSVPMSTGLPLTWTTAMRTLVKVERPRTAARGPGASLRLAGLGRRLELLGRHEHDLAVDEQHRPALVGDGLPVRQHGPAAAVALVSAPGDDVMPVLE